MSRNDVRSPAERHGAITWAQRLKRVFNIDFEVCGRCGGSVKVIACIENQNVIGRILAHLRDREQGAPTLPHLAPPTRAHLRHCPFSPARKLALRQSTSTDATE